MSDNLRRFIAIRTALNKFYPKQPQGNLARHLNSLAAMISGIIGSHSTNLPKMASKVPDVNKLDSREQRFSRWVNNTRIESKGPHMDQVHPVGQGEVGNRDGPGGLEGRQALAGQGGLIQAQVMGLQEPAVCRDVAARPQNQEIPRDDILDSLKERRGEGRMDSQGHVALGVHH